MPKVGEVIVERYELLAHLGDGGTASVWRAKDRTLEREVAIKFLYVVDERAVEDLRKQFLREARIASAVKHRNVIQTVDFGQTEEGRAYMVMELLHGEELTNRIDAQPRITTEEAVNIMVDVLRGLHAIHEAGIVHRDLKPENIYLERDQDSIYPKILDFGIAKNVTRGGSRRSVLTTKEGIVVGTPEYMPPEQARGVPDLDARADIWSVGVILFELLSGRLPFDEPSEAEVIIKIVTTDAPLVTSVNPDVPKAISEVIAKALSREREQRYANAGEMQRALIDAARVLHGEQPLAVVRQRQRRNRWLLASAAIVLAATAWQLRPRAEVASSAIKPEKVTVELRGVPEAAQVFVNGKRADGTKLSLPNDGYSRLIEVRANGREEWRVLHPSGNNANYEVRMPLVASRTVPEASAATAPAPAPNARVESKPSATPAQSTPSRSERRAQHGAQSKDAAGVAKGGKKAPAVWRNLDF
jgi:serine/threonine protein kinase